MTLDEIVKDLQACKEYNQTGTLQAAFRFCENLRVDTLALAQVVSDLQFHAHGLDILTDRVSDLEVYVRPTDNDIEQ